MISVFCDKCATTGNQIKEEAASDEALRQASLANPIDSFKYVFDKALEDLIIDRMEIRRLPTNLIEALEEFQKAVSNNPLQQVYEQINAEKSISGQK